MPAILERLEPKADSCGCCHWGGHRRHRQFRHRGRGTRDPIGYSGGINLYEYVASSPVGNVDGAGWASALAQYIYWHAQAGYFENLAQAQGNLSSAYMAQLQAQNLASRIEASNALQDFMNHHHGDTPLQKLQTLEKKVKKMMGKLLKTECPSPAVSKAVGDLKKAIAALEASQKLGSANAIQQVKGLGNALGLLSKFFGPETGVGPILGFYANALNQAATEIGRIYQSAGQQNLQAWALHAGAPNTSASIPFSDPWAAQVMQSAGQSLGPLQPAFVQAMDSPVANEVVSGGINGNG